MKMGGHRLGGPGGERPRTGGPRKDIRAELEALHAQGVSPQRLVTCHPQGEGQKLNDLLLDIEPKLRAVAEKEPGFSMSAGLIDKARQNPINHLGGEDCGDAAISAHFKVTTEALALVAAQNGARRIDVPLARVSPKSDEGIGLVLGTHLPRDIGAHFKEAWGFLRGRLDLREFKYAVEAGKQRERFVLDLEAFSRILRYPDLILAMHHSMSAPAVIAPDARPGFLLDAIRRLENREIRFKRFLPPSFRGNGGLPEVLSPFEFSLASLGKSRTESGCFVEIKLMPERPKDAVALLEFVRDGWGTRHGIRGETWGTRKGFAEIYSGRFGMRGLNTFLGKAGANRVLTPVAQAMGELEKEVPLLPVAGGYLQYWVELPYEPRTVSRVMDAVGSAIDRNADSIHGRLRFRPSIIMLDAIDADVSDVRPKLIFESLGRGGLPPSLLHKVDFVLNFIENVDAGVQDAIYAALQKKENGGQPVSRLDMDYVGMVRAICDMRRTVRDAEDIIWLLRKDEELPDGIRNKRSDIENWLLGFAMERAERIFYLLVKKVSEIGGQG